MGMQQTFSLMKLSLRLGISSGQLKAVKTPLQGFGVGVIIPKSVIELLLTLSSDKEQVTESPPFQVVRTPVAYNAILGRLLFNKIPAIVSTCTSP